MNLLDNSSGQIKFVINDHESIEVENLNKDQLKTILSNIYDKSDFYDINWNDEIKNQVHNTVHKEIVEQIVSKIIDFKSNVDNIKNNIESSFPLINDK
ncbi:hypothetical protein [Fructobacillus tropaeoli]|uniref:Uncharacterized protein n=1 Tax=Fructobacillus tropaeoli TaxID=709323 RepID=A0A3F3H3R5_9LACO|nr:hypothetical protein [Fructobacillus tropaeoli]GAP04462.1 hypothetical protein FTRO_0050150 [Fructobacillus tropaeoli]